VSNLTIRGEKIDTLEVVGEHRPASHLVLRSSLYRWAMRGLIGLGTDPVTGLPQYQNRDDVNAHGLELSADSTWASAVRLRGSVSLQHAAYASGAAMFNSPHVLGRLNLSGPLPWAGATGGFEARYDGTRTTMDGSTLPHSLVCNLNLSMPLSSRVAVSLGVQNLLDAHYSQPGSRNNWQNSLEQDGRSIQMRLDYRL
jgi:outer membrane receptor protein involved in Fe transport